MRYNNFVFTLLVQVCTVDTCARLLKRKQLATKLDFTPGWLDNSQCRCFKRHTIWSTTIGYVVKDERDNTIIAEGEQIADCSIILAECFAMQKALVMATQNIQGIIVKIYFELVVNAILDKIATPKDIINFVEDIRKTCP